MGRKGLIKYIKREKTRKEKKEKENELEAN